LGLHILHLIHGLFKSKALSKSSSDSATDKRGKNGLCFLHSLGISITLFRKIDGLGGLTINHRPTPKILLFLIFLRFGKPRSAVGYESC